MVSNYALEMVKRRVRSILGLDGLSDIINELNLDPKDPKTWTTLDAMVAFHVQTPRA